MVKKLEYDTFGNVISDSDPSFAMPFGFAGGLRDADTDLVRFGFRDYDPETGRWTAKDPILFAGGDTDLYGYCVNDPVNLTDFEGLFSKWTFIGAITGAVGGWMTVTGVVLQVPVIIGTITVSGPMLLVAGAAITLYDVWDSVVTTPKSIGEKAGERIRKLRKSCDEALDEALE